MTTTEFPTPLADPDFGNLSVLGHRDRLHEPGISLCGSRAAGTKGIEFAKAVGLFAAEMNLPLVSGYAKGVDLAGHVACVQSGGHTIAVLAEGMSGFRLRRELKAVIEPWDDAETYLTVVSEFEGSARWTVWRAMKRNTLICSLGKVLVAIDPGESGGTLDAVKKAIKREMPVVIGWSDSEQNHDHLNPLLANPNVLLVTAEDDLITEIEQALEAGSPVTEVRQLNLL